MKHNSNEDKWIEEVLNSTQGMRKAAPRTDLYEHILLNLNNNVTKTRSIPMIRYWAAAAVLLAIVNLGTITYYNLGKSPATQLAATENTANPFGIEIQAASTYNY